MPEVDDSSPALTVVKIILTTMLVVLAAYQVTLMAVGYGKLRLPFLRPGPASRAHRAIGDTMVALSFLVGALCVAFYEVGDAVEDGGRTAVHVVAGSVLLLVLAGKVLAVRVGGRLAALLPALGLTVFGLFVVTWASSALYFLGG